MKVVYVDPSLISHTFDKSVLENKTASEIGPIINCKSEQIAIHTPLFIRRLESDSTPINNYPDLLVQTDYKKYNRPNTFLLELDPKFNGMTFINVRVDTTEPFPSIYVPFNNNLANASSTDLIQQIEKTFGYETISPELFIGSKSCEQMKASEIFNEIFSNQQQLTIKCQLNDRIMKCVRMRKNILEEVISTEKTYISDLTTIIEFWKVKLEENKMLTQEESLQIFKDFPIILAYQQTFLSELQSCGTDFTALVAHVFIQFSQFFKSAKLYIGSYNNVVQILTRKENDNGKFREKMTRLADETSGRDLASYLITPVQRMPRYILFLRELLKYTPDFHPDKNLLQVSYTEIEKVTREIDKSSGLAERQQEFYRIQVSLGSKVSVLAANRTFEMEVEVKYLKYPKYDLSKSKTKLFLFNDLVVISKDQSLSHSAEIVFYAKLDDVSFIRNMPTFDSVIFYSKEPLLVQQKVSTIKTFVAVRFNNPKERDDVLKRITKNIPLSQEQYFFKDIAMTNLPPVMVGHRIAPIGPICYSIGGMDVAKTIVAIDLTHGTIEYIKSSFPILHGHTIAAIGDEIYVCGGQTNGKMREETWKWKTPFDKHPAGKCVTVLKNGFPTRFDHTMNVWKDKLIVYGGKGNGTTIFDNIAIFDPNNAKAGWVVNNNVPNTPQKRAGHTTVLYNDKLIVYGGANGGSTYSDIQILNLNEMVWEKQPKLTGDELPPRAYHQSILLEIGNNNYMFTFGGNVHNASTAHLVDLDTFEVKGIQIVGNTPPTLSNFTLLKTDDGDLIIIGGQVGELSTNLVLALNVPRTEIEQPQPTQPETPQRKFDMKNVRKVDSVTCKLVMADDVDEIRYVDKIEKIEKNPDDESSEALSRESSQAFLESSPLQSESSFALIDTTSAQTSTEPTPTKVAQEPVEPVEPTPTKPVQAPVEPTPTKPVQTPVEPTRPVQPSTEPVQRDAQEDIKVQSNSESTFTSPKADLKLPNFLTTAMLVLPCLAALFFALALLTPSVFVLSLLFAVLTIAVIILRTKLIERKEETLERILTDEIKNNNGFVNKMKFVLHYEPASSVFDMLVQKNIQKKNFLFTQRKSEDDKLFDAIELNKFE